MRGLTANSYVFCPRNEFFGENILLKTSYSGGFAFNFRSKGHLSDRMAQQNALNFLIEKYLFLYIHLFCTESLCTVTGLVYTGVRVKFAVKTVALSNLRNK
jgi:hypothetical protein